MKDNDFKYTVYDNFIHIKINISDLVFMHSHEIKRTISELAQENDLDITIDMSNVSYVDSSFLSVFIDAFKVLSRKHKTIALKNPQQHVVEILQMMNLDKILNITRDVNGD